MIAPNHIHIISGKNANTIRQLNKKKTATVLKSTVTKHIAGIGTKI